MSKKIGKLFVAQAITLYVIALWIPADAHVLISVRGDDVSLIWGQDARSEKGDVP